MAVTQDRWAAGDLSVRWPGIGGESPEQVATRGSRGLLVRTALAIFCVPPSQLTLSASRASHLRGADRAGES